MKIFSGPCPVCGGEEFLSDYVLWPELVNEWQLSEAEVAYINRQQGFHCVKCKNNLRAMALAHAIATAYEFTGELSCFAIAKRLKDISILEINPAGQLTPILSKMPNHRLIEYPEHDMTCLDFESEFFDLVIHSDTLEHIKEPIDALSECRRVLKKTGRCIFTIPIVIDRLTKSRRGMKSSYHGSPGEGCEDLLVYTEYGADFWKSVLEAGFGSVMIHCIEYPAGLAIEARA